MFCNKPCYIVISICVEPSQTNHPACFCDGSTQNLCLLQCKQLYYNVWYPLKTGIPVAKGDSILKLLQRVSRPEIQLGVFFIQH